MSGQRAADRRHHQQCPQPQHGNKIDGENQTPEPDSADQDLHGTVQYPAKDEHPGKPDGPVTGANRHQCQAGDVDKKIANHAWYTFWYVLPTLPMFLVFPSGVAATHWLLADLAGVCGDDGGVVCGVRAGDAAVWG